MFYGASVIVGVNIGSGLILVSLMPYVLRRSKWGYVQSNVSPGSSMLCTSCLMCCTFWQNVVWKAFRIYQYSVLLISCSHFSPNDSWKTPIVRPLGQVMGVFCEFEVWLKFYLCCVWCNILSWCTMIYRVYSILEYHWTVKSVWLHPGFWLKAVNFSHGLTACFIDKSGW